MPDRKVFVKVKSAGPFYPGDEATLEVRIDPPLGMLSKQPVVLNCPLFDQASLSLRASGEVKVRFKAAGSDTVAPVSIYPVGSAPTISVLPLPAVSFETVPISGEKIPEEDAYRIGPAQVRLKLSAEAPPKGAVAVISGECLNKEYKVKFGGRNRTAVQQVVLIDTSGLARDLQVAAESGCADTTPPAKVAVAVSQPTINFADPPFDTTVGRNRENKPLFRPGQQAKVKVRLNYPAPHEVKATITCPSLESTASVTIAKGRQEADVNLKFTSDSSGFGDRRLELSIESGCLLGDNRAIDIAVQPPLAISFVEETSWITPEQDFCIGDEAEVQVELNHPAPFTGNEVYALVSINNKPAGQIRIPQGERKGSAKITF